ncbi:hypothetical protein SAMN05444672_103113 [Bacillus sp. OK838]|nr:hypothetical protein SAMN05444672_103113 [Bacillus sp. OK838]
MFSTEGANPKKQGTNLSGKRTTIGRVSEESHRPPKELNSQVKGQRKVGKSLSFLCPFFTRKDKKRGGALRAVINESIF